MAEISTPVPSYPQISAGSKIGTIVSRLFTADGVFIVCSIKIRTRLGVSHLEYCWGGVGVLGKMSDVPKMLEDRPLEEDPHTASR